MSNSGLSQDQALKLLKNGKHSDFIVKCRGKTFPVHKFMLAFKSSFFNAAIDSGFKEGKSNEIEIKETDPFSVATVLVHLYTGKSHEWVHEAWPYHFMKLHEVATNGQRIAIYRLADRLMVNSLKKAVGNEMSYDIKSALEHAASCEKEKCHDQVYEAVSNIYTKLPASDNYLRPSITNILLKAEDEAASVIESLKIVKEGHARKRSQEPIVIDSDSETSSDTTDSEDDDEGALGCDYGSTMKELMELAEEQDGSAVRSGRLILQEAREEIKLMQARHARQLSKIQGEDGRSVKRRKTSRR